MMRECPRYVLSLINLIELLQPTLRLLLRITDKVNLLQLLSHGCRSIEADNKKMRELELFELRFYCDF